MFYGTTMVVVASLQLLGLNQATSLSDTDTLTNTHYFFYQNSEYPKDCRDVQRQCPTKNLNGVYVIKPDGYREPFEVFCNNEIDSGGWTVIQRRDTSIVNFNRTWAHYSEGFGFLSTDFFLGNEKLAYLTNQAAYELLVVVELENGCLFHTNYKDFRITDEFGQYVLKQNGSIESNASLCVTDCPANEFFINECTEKCYCIDNRLDRCTAERCDDNANCEVSNGVEMCSCKDGYEGDGLTCRQTTTAATTTTQGEGHKRDCKEIYDNVDQRDGVYTIIPDEWTGQPFDVYCNMDNGGGWTVFQRRRDDTQSFYQTWTSYKDGFGDLNNNFWLGNEKLYHLTKQKNYELRLDITTSDGTPLYAEYSEFQIESESTNYTMNKLGARSTTDGGFAGSGLANNRGRQFSTYDRDNDQCSHFNCAEKHRSGWWHIRFSSACTSCFTTSTLCNYFPYNGNCHSVCTDENLNGDYNGNNGERIFSGGRTYCNPQVVELKIRPSS